MTLSLLRYLALSEEAGMFHKCVAGCGHIHSVNDKESPVLICGVGMVCSRCFLIKGSFQKKESHITVSGWLLFQLIIALSWRGTF